MSQFMQWQTEKMRHLGLYQKGTIINGEYHMEARDNLTGELYMLARAESFVEAEKSLFCGCLRKRLNEEKGAKK